MSCHVYSPLWLPTLWCGEQWGGSITHSPPPPSSSYYCCSCSKARMLTLCSHSAPWERYRNMLIFQDCSRVCRRCKASWETWYSWTLKYCVALEYTQEPQKAEYNGHLWVGYCISIYLLYYFMTCKKVYKSNRCVTAVKITANVEFL